MKFEKIDEQLIVLRENGEDIGVIVEQQISDKFYTYGFKSDEGIILLLDDLEEISEYIKSMQ